MRRMKRILVILLTLTLLLGVLPGFTMSVGAQEEMQAEAGAKKAIYILPDYMTSKLYGNHGRGEEAWLNPDFLKQEIGNYWISGITPVFAGKPDGSGGGVDVDRTRDLYGIKDTYQVLYDELTAECGEEYDVIFYPYNWLGDLNDSARLLRRDLQRNGYEKVILVAHGTGGLLAASFIAQSRENMLRTEKVFLLGVPLYGTCAGLLPMETGEYQGLIQDSLKDVQKPAARSWVKAVTRNAPTAYQMLPSAEYLKQMPALYIKNSAKGLATPAAYYDVLNRSGSINSGLTNGNDRSHRYFRETTLGGDIVSVFQSVHTVLIGAGGGIPTPSIAVYAADPQGGTRCAEILYQEDGDGTVMRYSYAGGGGFTWQDSWAAEGYSYIRQIKHADWPTEMAGTISGNINRQRSYSAAGATMLSSSITGMVKLIVTADQPIDITVTDHTGAVAASFTDDAGWVTASDAFLFDLLYRDAYDRDDDGVDDQVDFSAQLYVPDSGYQVSYAYGSDAGTAVHAALEVSTLNWDGYKTAIAAREETVTGEHGSLFAVSGIDVRIEESTLADVTGCTVTEVNTAWRLKESMLVEPGSTTDGVLVSSSVRADELTWTSSDTDVVTVDADGKITAVGYGKALVTAAQAGSLQTDVCEVSVKLDAASVSFPDLRMVVGERVKIQPVFDNPLVTDSVTYSVDEADTEIVSVFSSFNDIYNDGVIAKSEGTATVTGTASGGASGTFTVTVETAGAVPLLVTGPEEAARDSREIAYTVSGRNMKELCVASLTMELNDKLLRDVSVEAVDGWRILASAYQDGVLRVLAFRVDGANGDGDILNVSAVPAGKIGEMTLYVTDAELTAYEGEDNEVYVDPDLWQAFASTALTYSIFDLDRNGVVDQLDITCAQRFYGGSDADGDVNRDGIVNISDLILILSNYTGRD